MQSEWQSRLDFFLVLAAIVVITFVVFRLLGPQVYALTEFVLTRIANFIGGINNLVGGVLGTRKP